MANKENQTTAAVSNGAAAASPLGSVSSLNMDDLKAAGFEQKNAPLVKLDVGQTIQGKFVGVTQFESTEKNEDGSAKMVNGYLLETKVGTFKVNGATTLDQALANVKPGDDVLIARYPDQQSGRKRTVHDMRAFVKPAKR